MNFTDAGAANSTVTLTEVLQPFSVSVNSASNYTLTGAGSITGTTGLTKSGAGALILQSANTYAGVTTISGGVVELQNVAALGTTAGNTVVAAGGQLSLQNIGDLAEPIALNGTGVAGAGAIRNIAGAKTLTAPITLQSASSIVNADAANALTFGGTLGGSFGLTLSGPGTFVLSGSTANTNSSTTIQNTTVVLSKTVANGTVGGTVNIGDGVSPATLRLGVAEQIGNGALVNVAANATFDLAGFAETIGSLAGAGTVTLGAGNLILNGTTTETFSGVISGGGSFTRQNGGTTILIGQNTYAGQTIIANANSKIVLGVNDALPVGTTVNFSGTTNVNVALDLNGKNQTIAALISAANGAGTSYVQNDSGAGRRS
ncbi:MAG: autotransporter-associated beta strand repeat-containing protein [Pirellulales bacterium]